MKPGPARQVFQSLFGLERRGTLTRFLYAILLSVIVVDTIMILLRLWHTRANATQASRVLVGLLIFQFVLLYIKRGYVEQTVYALVIGSWVVVTYLIWTADGVRDVALYLYFVILLIAALFTNWRLIFVLSILSIGSIWILALAEEQGFRVAHPRSPRGR